MYTFKSLILFFILCFALESFAELHHGSECYKSELDEKGKPISRSVEFTIPSNNKLVLKSRVIWRQEDYEVLHRYCREEKKCMLASGASLRRDDDPENGWNEALIGTITCQNTKKAVRRKYRNSYDHMVVDRYNDFGPFLNDEQKARANEKNKALQGQGRASSSPAKALDDR